jgi:hypothetical protein
MLVETDEEPALAAGQTLTFMVMCESNRTPGLCLRMLRGDRVPRQLVGPGQMTPHHITARAGLVPYKNLTRLRKNVISAG